MKVICNFIKFSKLIENDCMNKKSLKFVIFVEINKIQ